MPSWFPGPDWEKDPLASSLPRMSESQTYFFSLRNRAMEEPGVRQGLCGP